MDQVIIYMFIKPTSNIDDYLVNDISNEQAPDPGGGGIPPPLAIARVLNHWLVT